MFIKKIKYTDFLGVDREETFYFNLSKAEIADLNMQEDGRLTNFLQELVAAKDNKEMWNRLISIILKSYGKLSGDGRRLEKSPELSKAFTETPAYDELLEWLTEDPEKNMATFFNNVIPSDKKQDNRPQLEVVSTN